MAKFSIIPKDGGTARYSGCPTFTGTYMKPGFLEFREVSSPTPIDWAIGDYVVYTRTGFTYRLYSIPQLKKQARSSSYGGAFVYQGVQLFDASKMLEYCPFRDLVLGDNRIHFSTQPSISTFEGCDGLARRFEACLCDQYGANSWRVRIATSAENPDLYDLMMEPREFTVSGVNILECLDKIYEIWPEVGWVYKVENGIDTIVIGGGGINSNTGTYAYGKGNGLTSLTRTAANAEEIANRIFAYGSSRNMVLPSWYRNQDIKDAESVDIENLMLPILPIVSKNWAGWGLTGGKRDAAKAFVENSASILKNGLRPATVYFDGKGEYPEIYPSIRETTIGMVRNALGDSTAKYYPSSAIYTDPTARIDTLLSVQSSFDSGKQSTDGKSAVATDYADISETGSGTAPAGSQHNEVIFEETMTVAEAGTMALSATAALTGSITAQVHSVILTVLLSVNGNAVDARSEELENNGSQWALHTVNVGYQKFALSVGDTVTCTAYIQVVNFGSNTDASFSYSATGNYSIKLSLFREKTFKVSLRQLGFDINEQADLGDGKTIAMRTGDCAGRSFSIKSAQYNSANDCWDLECWRSEDESLSQWFPNSQFGVAVGDEFVLLDIAMPDIYIAMASEKLLDAARELLEDSAVERWQYIPEIDAKFMVENSRTINAGEYLILSDADIIGPSSEAILVDTITINEGEAAIPTYKVTLRDRKKKTWTESQSPEQSSSKSVGSITESTSYGGDSYFQLDENGNVTLKPQYQNLWVPGWLANGGIGQGGSGSGGGGLITSVKGVADLGTPIAVENLTETFSAKAIESIWEAVLGLQQSMPSVSLNNGASYSTIAINGTSANFYTKAQVDTLLNAINAFDYVVAASLPTASANTMYKIYLIPSADPQTGNIKDEYITIRGGSEGGYTYSWEQIGSTAIDLTGYATESWVNQQGFLKTETDPTVPAWAKASTKPSYSLSEISGTDDLRAIEALAGTVGFLKKTAENTWALDTTQYLSAHQSVTLESGTNNGTLKLTTSAGAVDNIAVKGLQALAYKASLIASDIPDLSETYVTLGTAQTISGAKTFSGGITMSGASILTSADSTNNIGTSSSRFLFAHIRNIFTTYFGFVSDDGQTQTGVLDFGDGRATIHLLKPDGTQYGNYSFFGEYGFFHSGDGNVPCGRSDHRWEKVWSVDADLSGNMSLGGNIVPATDNTGNIGTNDLRFSNAYIRNIYTTFFQFRDGTTKTPIGQIAFGEGYAQFSLLGNDAKTFMFYSDKFFASGGNADLGLSDHRWSNIYGVNANLTGDLSLASTSHIDIGPARIEYDATNGAIHVTTNQTGNNAPTIGFYADGFSASGGVGEGGGGGGWINANDFGFLPSNTATVNAAALNECLRGGGKTVIVSQPGTYQLDSTILLYDDTTLVFGDGVVIKKAGSQQNVFRNEGATARTYNRNIRLLNLVLSVSGSGMTNDVDSEIFGLRGEVAFLCTENVSVSGFRCEDLGSGAYAIQFNQSYNFLVENFVIRGQKDGIHISSVDTFVIRHGVFRTGDDALALNACDWVSSNCVDGDITNGIIEDVTDEATSTAQGGYGCRLLVGAWKDWSTGMSIRRGDTVVSNGRIYRAYTASPTSTVFTSAVRPTITTFSGKQQDTGGFYWKLMRSDKVYYSSNIVNVEFRNIRFLSQRRGFVEEVDTDDQYNRSLYPTVAYASYPKVDISVNGYVYEDASRSPFVFSGNTHTHLRIDGMSGSGATLYVPSPADQSMLMRVDASHIDFRSVSASNFITNGYYTEIRLMDCVANAPIPVASYGRIITNNNLASLPGDPAKGDQVIHNGTPKVYNGSSWTPLI